MRRDIPSRSLALALQYACISEANFNTYTDIVGVSQFITELHLSHTAESHVASALRGLDVGHISKFGEQERASLTCQLLGAVLGETDVVSEYSHNYTDLVEVNWCDSCWFEPQCIAQPKSAKDVSKALLITTFLGSKFAVRSGGHNPNPGFGGIGNHGLLIDMSHLDDIILSKDRSVVSIGPGNRAGRVYKTLGSVGKTIMGARLNSVGVGGYFLGGGLTYFNGRYGLAADNIINYEVVLANSSIVNANATSNQDLWWALKGGGPNFGIVTKYAFETIDNISVWFEGLSYDPSQSDKLLDAVFEYAHAAEKDLDAAITFSLTPESGFVEFIYGKPVVRPSTYRMFYPIPSSGTVFNSRIGDMGELNDAISNITSLDKARRMIGSISYKFDLTTLKKSYAMLLVLDSKVRRFNASMGFIVQPFTSSAVRHSSKTGGNPVGFKPVLQNLMTYSIVWEDSYHDAEALTAISGYTKEVEELAKRRGVYLESKAMNDSGFMQNVLGSFGAKNLERLRRISRRYDPLQVFQRLQNDGFLLRKT